MPLQVADLRRPQAMAVGDQDHGRVAMPVAAMLSGAVHQPLNLALGEVAPLDCQVYDAWGAFLGCRFHADKPSLRVPLLYKLNIFIEQSIDCYLTSLTRLEPSCGSIRPASLKQTTCARLSGRMRGKLVRHD